MQLYLVQHGDALDKEQNPDRPLSERGAREVECVGAFLARKTSVEEVWHSGKLRAVQTAERFATHVGRSATIVRNGGLGPTDPALPIAELAGELDRRLMIVGHLPQLDKLASLLVAGDEAAGVARFRKGGVLCLERGDDGYAVAWMVTPELLGM